MRAEPHVHESSQSVLHNIGVVIVGFGIAFLCPRIDASLGVRRFHAVVAIAAGLPIVDRGIFCSSMGNVPLSISTG